MSIRVQNLSKKYGEQIAVNNISFEIKKGEIVGFLGPNGAGKSTTMKMITGYLSPDEGEISVCGLNTNRNLLESKKKIGYLPEANPLYYDMYIREYLTFVSNLHQLTSQKKVIETVIDTVGLGIESHKKIGQLSKGYKQRVGLAAALVHNPEVLILDEPTSGLDPNQIVDVRSVIKQLSENKTILFSSHIMQEIESLCERVIIINKGNIVADDTVSALRNASGNNHQVSIEFAENIANNAFDKFNDVISLQKLNARTFVISTSNPESVRKQILELSIDQNLNIVALQTSQRNLESVFKSLTT